MADGRRVFVIGLDGATFTVLDDLRGRGLMPHLDRLIGEGSAGVLTSTMPPITPAAWTTFMTGQTPGRHGIIDFERYDAGRHALEFNTTEQMRGRARDIWRLLSDRGVRVGSLHLPMTYPPYEVNGFMVSGFDTPSIENEFTYPAELKREILSQIADYSYSTNWRRRLFGGDALFAENCAYISRSFEQAARLAELCGEKYGWDLMMVLLKLVDNLQHKAWKHLDPRTAERDPTRRRIVVDCFAVLDACIGRLVDYARRVDRESIVMVLSDHGHGSLDGTIQANLLLRNWGYLRLKGLPARIGVRAARGFRRAWKHPRGRFSGGVQAIERELAVDWPRTQACVMHAGIYGFVYINLRGRQPEGIACVEAGRYEALRDELQDRFLSFADPVEGGKVIGEVHKPEQLYGCRREDFPEMPDLMLVPRPGLSVVRKIRGTRPVIWYPPDDLGGTHRLEGVLVVQGPGIKAGHRTEGNLVDVTPTILAAMGQPIPDDMDGRVLTDLFEAPPEVRYEAAAERREPSGSPEEAAEAADVLSEEEKRALTERLSDLGYLE